MKQLILLSACLACFSANAQPYAPVRTNWQDAGHTGPKPAFGRTVNILHYGADNTGAQPCGAALTSAISALNGGPGTVFFPAGTYYFKTAVTISRDSLILRGAGHDSTRLRFDLAGTLSSLIQIGGADASDTSMLTTAAERGSGSITVGNAAAFQPGDWLRLSMDDRAWITSPWAVGSLTQTIQVQGISGDTVTFRSPFRINYPLANRPVVRKVLPRQSVGIECLAVQRIDATAGQASNIVFEQAANCWVAGIESDNANFAHIEVNRSSNVEVTNSYIHHAFAYGGGGQGYGVVLQFGSNECKVEANYFHRLRHAMLLQSGANGNVLAYNYSTEPFWTEPFLPDSAAGDLVLHGDYPFMNLAEGNFVRNIVIDDSHGKNGPLNTFFRNRAEGYGIFMNFSPATDSVQLIGNEITNPTIGLYFINGTGHFQYGNNYRGTITGGGTANIPDTSLYLPAGQKPPCPTGYDAWPPVGRPDGYNTGTIYAKARVLRGEPAACACVPVPARVPAEAGRSGWTIYPNPSPAFVTLSGPMADRIEVYDLAGKKLREVDYPVDNRMSVSNLVPGIYLIRVTGNGRTAVMRLMKN